MLIMPYVFELDIPYKSYDIGNVYEEFEKLGSLGAYYHAETSVCVIGAKNRNEAIDFIFNFINDLDFDEYKNKPKLEMSSEIIPGLPNDLENEIKKELEEVGKRVREHEKVDSKSFERVPMMECLFVKSKVLNYLRQEGFSPTREVIDGSVLNIAISDTLDRAIGEARTHDRETVEAEDFKKAKEVSSSVDDTLFVKKIVHNYVESKGFTPSSDVLKIGGVIDNAIADLLERAIKNAKKDNRSEIVGGKDFFPN